MAHIHSVYDTDNHFKINPVNREISDISDSKTMLIQYDHNSERFTFEMPRYIEGHDMLTCNEVHVHYLNVSTNKQEQNAGVYLVDDLQESPEDENIVVCSWLVSQNATRLVGSLNFLLRFVCRQGGEADYVWNTGIYSNIRVSDGIYNGDTIIEELPDILTLWVAKIDPLPVPTDKNNGLYLCFSDGVYTFKNPTAGFAYESKILKLIEESETETKEYIDTTLDEKVNVAVEKAKETLGDTLPEIQKEDVGKIMQVVGGEWQVVGMLDKVMNDTKNMLLERPVEFEKMTSVGDALGIGGYQNTIDETKAIYQALRFIHENNYTTRNYIVVWNGEEYECASDSVSNAFYLGDRSFWASLDKSDFPFGIKVDTAEQSVIVKTRENGTTHTLAIKWADGAEDTLGEYINKAIDTYMEKALSRKY